MKKTYAPPPKVGDKFLGPPIPPLMAGTYEVRAIVDLGVYEGEPTFYWVVFCFYSPRKGYKYDIVTADAIDCGLYTPKKKAKSSNVVD